MFQKGLGDVVVSAGASVFVDDATAWGLLNRHSNGDWGSVSASTAKENDYYCEHLGEVLSQYDVAGQKVWIITDEGHETTTVLLPEDY